MSTASPDPSPELDARYSTPDAVATPWEEARDTLICADLYWVATVRSSGQPHVTPPLAVWADGAMHISTGDHEQKARNLAANPRCTLSTGRNTMDEGLALVVALRRSRAYAFRKGATFSQTRFRFS